MTSAGGPAPTGLVPVAEPAGSLAERAYRQLKHQIISGELAPGAAIIEGALAARLGCSKTPVREALQRLELEGLARVLPRVGYVVTPVSPDDVQALFELRIMLEPAATELAATRVGPDLLAELDELAQVSFAGADRANYAQFLDVNTSFHLAVVRAADNDRLTAIMSPLLAEMERILHLAVDLRDHTDLIIRDHVEIVESLRQRDAARARRVAERHLLASRDRALQAILAGKGLAR